MFCFHRYILLSINVFKQVLRDVWRGDRSPVGDSDNEAAFAFDSFNNAFAAGENTGFHAFVFSFEKAGVIYRKIENGLIVIRGQYQEGLHHIVRYLLDVFPRGVSVEERPVPQFASQFLYLILFAMKEKKSPDVIDPGCFDSLEFDVPEYILPVTNHSDRKPLQTGIVFAHIVLFRYRPSPPRPHKCRQSGTERKKFRHSVVNL